MLLPILHYPDSKLRLKALKVESIDDSIRKLVEDMAETMYRNNGCGLAATQINVQKRVIIMDLTKDNEEKHLQIFINPEILHKEGSFIAEEGCLSVPGIWEKVKRAEKVQLKYLDLDGKEHNIHCEGLLAHCAQHEIEHLDGILFVDHLSLLKQNFIKKKMKKITKPM